MSVRGSLVSVLLALPVTASASDTLAVKRCVEVRSCDAEGRCRENGTRLMLAEMDIATEGLRHLVMGPMGPDAGGGLFFAQDVQWVLGGALPPSPELGRAIRLGLFEDGLWAFVYRPGSEVAGLRGAEWVRADYHCEQVLF